MGTSKAHEMPVWWCGLPFPLFSERLGKLKCKASWLSVFLIFTCVPQAWQERVNLIKINGEKEWDKSQYEYSQCLYASVAYAGSCLHSKQQLLQSTAEPPCFPLSPRNNSFSKHCSSNLEAALSFPNLFCLDGWWSEAVKKVFLQSLPVCAILSKQMLSLGSP